MVYIEKKIKNSKCYFYHTKGLRISGKIKKIRRYIGNDIEKANLKSEFLKSIERFTEKEMELIPKNYNNSNLKYSPNLIIEIFKKNILISNLKEFDPNIDLKIEKDFPIKFIYNSNSIEGSRISFNEVEKILNSKKSQYQNKNEIKEVKN